MAGGAWISQKNQCNWSWPPWVDISFTEAKLIPFNQTKLNYHHLPHGPLLHELHILCSGCAHGWDAMSEASETLQLRPGSDLLKVPLLDSADVYSTRRGSRSQGWESQYINSPGQIPNSMLRVTSGADCTLWTSHPRGLSVAAEKKCLQFHMPPVVQEDGVATCIVRTSSTFLPKPNWSVQSRRQHLTKCPPPHSAPPASPSKIKEVLLKVM